MDNKIIISKSKLIKSLNFSESNRLILGTSGEGQPIHLSLIHISEPTRP